MVVPAGLRYVVALLLFDTLDAEDADLTAVLLTEPDEVDALSADFTVVARLVLLLVPMPPREEVLCVNTRSSLWGIGAG